MPYLRDRVFVLKKDSVREHDRRYVFYGREHGLLIAVARGIAKPTSKQIGHLEPFVQADVMLAAGKAGELVAVAREVSAKTSCFPSSLGGIALMGGCTDLVTRLVRPGVSDARIFDLLTDVHAIATSFVIEPTPIRARFLFSITALKLLDFLGFAPSLEQAALRMETRSLLRFVRERPIVDALRITAPVETFQALSAFVDEALKETSLERAPHAPQTIAAFL